MGGVLWAPRAHRAPILRVRSLQWGSCVHVPSERPCVFFVPRALRDTCTAGRPGLCGFSTGPQILRRRQRLHEFLRQTQVPVIRGRLGGV